MIRVLEIISHLERSSGVAQVVLNWYGHIDRTQLQFDFLFFEAEDTALRRELENAGARCYRLPHPYKAPLKFLRECRHFFKTHRYRIVHSHITHLNFFFYPLAKMFGAKYIIQHAHGTRWSDKKLSGLRNYLMLHAVWPLITHKIACSRKAGKVFFANKCNLINNGIDTEKFTFDVQVRDNKRKELGLENAFVIGHVGRFSAEKNHAFLLDIFAAVAAKDPAARLVLVGEGPLSAPIKALAAAKKLQDNVLFLGLRTDVAQLYQAFDVLVLPSFHEGMPVVGVEAQAAGLPGVFADTITPEVLLLPSSCTLPLGESAEVWAEHILALKGEVRQSGTSYLRQKGFDIWQTAKEIQNFYRGLN